MKTKEYTFHHPEEGFFFSVHAENFEKASSEGLYPYLKKRFPLIDRSKITFKVRNLSRKEINADLEDEIHELQDVLWIHGFD